MRFEDWDAPSYLKYAVSMSAMRQDRGSGYRCRYILRYLTYLV